MKTCPFCAEEIQDAAIKCRYCGEFLDGRAGSSPPGPGVPWCFRTYVIVIAVGCVGPFALPLIWWHPKLSWPGKLIWTVVIALLTWLMVIIMMHSLSVLKEYYDLMRDF